MATAEPAAVVVIDYAELLADTTSEELRKKIEQGYGYEGLGIVVIRGVPGFGPKREAALPQAYKFGHLPEEVKEKYVHAKSVYSFGWSHGKEKLEGKPDIAKGSFYFNPIHDRPVDDEAVIEAHAPFAHPNIWPSETDAPGFEAACKDAGRAIVEVGELLARHCDNYVKSVDPTYSRHLAGIIRTARCHKGRLLYYFPFASAPTTAAATAATAAAGGAAATATAAAGAPAAATGDDDVSNWCGWHNDHGSLTGLTPAMFFDKDGKAIACPDPRAGLYARTRQGKTVRVAIPADCMAFQIGEAAQVHTGGVLQATPHCVRAAEVEGVSRGTMAVFMEPEWDMPMDAPSGADKDRVLRGARGELLPRGVPPLVDRWDSTGKEGQDFGGFTSRTLSMYY